MKRILVAAISAVVLGLVGCASESALIVVPHSPGAPTTTPKTMQAFHSDGELTAYLRELAAKQKRVMRMSTALYSDAAPANAPKNSAVAGLAGAGAKEESITNVQHAGVDEGGIVKVHGNYLVVLRRGRLFTVSIEDGDLRPVSSADASGPEINPRSTWYDELLISKDTWL